MNCSVFMQKISMIIHMKMRKNWKEKDITGPFFKTSGLGRFLWGIVSCGIITWDEPEKKQRHGWYGAWGKKTIIGGGEKG